MLCRVHHAPLDDDIRPCAGDNGLDLCLLGLGKQQTCRGFAGDRRERPPTPAAVIIRCWCDSFMERPVYF